MELEAAERDCITQARGSSPVFEGPILLATILQLTTFSSPPGGIRTQLRRLSDQYLATHAHTLGSYAKCEGGLSFSFSSGRRALLFRCAQHSQPCRDSLKQWRQSYATVGVGCLPGTLLPSAQVGRQAGGYVGLPQPLFAAWERWKRGRVKGLEPPVLPPPPLPATPLSRRQNAAGHV